MEGEFQIHLERIDGDMHVQLSGDFDGAAARRLISLLHAEDDGQGRVFVDARRLDRMHAIGCAIFKEGLNRFLLTEQRLVFIGYKGRALAHDGETVIPSAFSGMEADLVCSVQARGTGAGTGVRPVTEGPLRVQDAGEFRQEVEA